MLSNSLKTINLAIDVFGADYGESVIVEGCNLIANKLNACFIFIGKKTIIEPIILNCKNLKNYSIIDTPNFVKADEKGSEALRSGKDTSMRIGVDLVKDGKADAVISAGNTGALLSISYIVLRTIEGISRPAMTAYFPTKKGETAMLDLGANIECDSKNLVDFALMGSAFSRIILKSKNPTVGLLNVGAEAQKGSSVLQEAALNLADPSIEVNYFGFVEGNDIAEGNVDVIVTDGFSGNIALKTAEGTAKLVTYLLEKSFKSSIFSKIGYLFSKNGLMKMKDRVDPRKYNGAVLLGLNGIVVKSHGSTDPEGFSNAVKVGYEMVKGNFVKDLKSKISS
jgi:glycerol-3-phosphate acyltransferase PlsX